jgi:hypothetical protein
MTAEDRNHEAATDSRCEIAGRVSMVTHTTVMFTAGRPPRPYSSNSASIVGVGVVLAADSQATSSSGYELSIM